MRLDVKNSPHSHETNLQGFVRQIIEEVDPEPNREGLVETPMRYLKFLREFTSPPEVKYTTFASEGADQMIVQTNISFYSLCEHHMAPFFGEAHVAYIPNERIVGLSKLARTVEFYARRLQNQERITKQVAERLQKELMPKGVAVVLKARHLCMGMRGVCKPDALTTTSFLTGTFRDDLNCRQEFLNLIPR